MEDQYAVGAFSRSELNETKMAIRQIIAVKANRRYRTMSSNHF